MNLIYSYFRFFPSDPKALYVIFTWESGAQIYELVAQTLGEKKKWVCEPYKAISMKHWSERLTGRSYGIQLQNWNPKHSQSVLCSSWTVVIKSTVDELKKRGGNKLKRERGGSMPMSVSGAAYSPWVCFWQIARPHKINWASFWRWTSKLKADFSH